MSILSIFIIIIILIILIYFYGYIIENGNDISFNYQNLYFNNQILTIENCKEYLNFKEALEPYVQEYAKKEIIFYNNNIIKTSKVFYIIHGFNANKSECMDISKILADKYQYNCYFTRLPDHGVYNIESSNSTFYDYLRTIYNDLIICKLLGNEIIIISASTGSTYSIIVSVYFSDIFNITDNIMFSPNIEPHGLISLGTKILSSGYGNFLIQLTRNKLYIDNIKVSSNLFKPIIGSLKTLRDIKYKFINNCIIFSGENDELISNNAIYDFYKNIKAIKKHIYIIKNIKTHPINKINNNIILDKISFYFSTNYNDINEIIKL